MEAAVPTVLVIGSAHVAWSGVREEVRAARSLRLLHFTRAPREGIEVAARKRPDLTVLTTRPSGVGPAEVALAIREASPETRLVLLGDLVPDQEWAALRRVRAQAYLLWDDVSEGVGRILHQVAKSDLLIASRPVVERIDGSARPVPAISERQFRVLAGLLEGKTRKAMAAAGVSSSSTTTRDLEELRALFGVETNNQLCAKLGEVGIDRLHAAVVPEGTRRHGTRVG